jgi:hypothetical protein
MLYFNCISLLNTKTKAQTKKQVKYMAVAKAANIPKCIYFIKEYQSILTKAG